MLLYGVRSIHGFLGNFGVVLFPSPEGKKSHFLHEKIENSESQSNGHLKSRNRTVDIYNFMTNIFHTELLKRLTFHYQPYGFGEGLEKTIKNSRLETEA